MFVCSKTFFSVPSLTSAPALPHSSPCPLFLFACTPAPLRYFLLSSSEQMNVIGYNAAIHAASITDQPEKALELFNELKVRTRQNTVIFFKRDQSTAAPPPT